MRDLTVSICPFMVDLIRGEKRPQRRSEVEFKLREQEDKMCSQSSVNPRSAALWKGEFGRLKDWKIESSNLSILQSSTQLFIGPFTLVAQTAIAVDFKSGLLSSRACALSHLGEEPYFQ